MNKLPTEASTKLSAITGAAVDARDAAASAQHRIDELRKALSYGSHSGADAAGLEAELSRLDAVRAKANHRHGELSSLAASIQHWLRSLPPNAELVLAEPVTVKKRRDTALLEQLAQTRDQIMAAQSHLRSVKTAPLPKPDAKAAVRDYVQQLAQRGKPAVNLSSAGVSIRFAYAAGPLSTESMAALLAWVDADKIIAGLEAEIDLLPENKTALPAKEKTKRTTELTENLDELERLEEALVEAAIAEGADVLRRPTASPLAVLGLSLAKPKTRVRAAA